MALIGMCFAFSAIIIAALLRGWMLFVGQRWLRSTPGTIIVASFVALVLVTTVVLVIMNWGSIVGGKWPLLRFAVTVIAALGGIVAQAIMSNLDAKRTPLAGGWDYWLRPLLVFPIVIGVTWLSLPSPSPSLVLVLHVAFLNGYFWESVRGSAMPVPTPPTPPAPPTPPVPPAPPAP
jgi:hypothetical protein